MKIKYYRISYKNIGIYEAFKQELWNNNDFEIWKEFKNSEYSNWLSVPDKYTDTSRSYFTELGYNKFITKTFPYMKKYLNENDITTDTYELDYDKLNIIYEDEHQIVID